MYLSVESPTLPFHGCTAISTQFQNFTFISNVVKRVLHTVKLSNSTNAVNILLLYEYYYNNIGSLLWCAHLIASELCSLLKG